jgi:hypothetical protein
MSQNVGRIGDDRTALRRVRISEIRGSGEVKKNAFLPRKSGVDKKGLSVSIERPDLIEVHRAKFEIAGERCACFLIVGDIRKIGTVDVVPDADPQDPSHALIIGIPDVTLGGEDLAKAEYVASQLAKLAKRYDFPSVGPPG